MVRVKESIVGRKNKVVEIISKRSSAAQLPKREKNRDGIYLQMFGERALRWISAEKRAKRTYTVHGEYHFVCNLAYMQSRHTSRNPSTRLRPQTRDEQPVSAFVSTFPFPSSSFSFLNFYSATTTIRPWKPMWQDSAKPATTAAVYTHHPLTIVNKHHSPSL